MTYTHSKWPIFDEHTVAEVAKVLNSGKVNYWTGTLGKEFEQRFAKWCSADYAVAVANGTVALDLCWQALGIQPGDEVIVTPRTFLASATSIANTGAVPVFADVDLDSQNITAASIERVITKNTKAILCVHLAGWPCEMEKICDLADAHGIHVVEDCAQAHGAQLNNKDVGQFGKISAWSFCQDKIMSTGGEGGMVTTNDKALWSSVWSYKDHGKSWDEMHKKHEGNSFRWVHNSLGTNWRLTEMQSAIGMRQLDLVNDWVDTRFKNASLIWDTASKLNGIRVPEIPANIKHSAYRCYVFIEPASLASGWNRERILAELNSEGVRAFSGSASEVYREKAFEQLNVQPQNRLDNAIELGDTSLCFLCHPTMSTEELENTQTKLSVVMKKAIK